jgi:hypothetical protein
MGQVLAQAVACGVAVRQIAEALVQAGAVTEAVETVVGGLATKTDLKTLENVMKADLVAALNAQTIRQIKWTIGIALACLGIVMAGIVQIALRLPTAP